MKKTAILVISIFAVSYFAKSQSCTNCDANNVITPENYSSALGIENTSTGQGSFAAGKFNTADNVFTTALGFQNTASGQISVAAGNNILASGVYSLGFGSYLEATGSRSMVIGTGAAFGNPLTNSNPNSLMIGFGSNKPTLFISTAPDSDETGAIGIGNVTVPLAKLHIKSDLGEDAAMLIEPYDWNSNSWAEIRIGNSSNAVRSSYTYGLQFKTDHNYIFNSPESNVGIGVLTPHEKLEVAGNIRQSMGYYLITDKVKASGETGLKLQDDTGEGPVVKNGGKLGINVLNPNYDLQVDGTISTTGFRLSYGSGTAAPMDYEGFVLQADFDGNGTWVDPMNLDVDDNDWTVNGDDMFNNNPGNVEINNDLLVSGTSSTAAFQLNNSNAETGKVLQSIDPDGNADWVDPMSINVDDNDWVSDNGNVYRQTGKIGIGTDNPVELLQIGDRWTFHGGGNKIIGYNYNWDGLGKRIVEDEVSIIKFSDNGNIEFLTAPFGAAGSQITNWNNPLTLLNNGNVGVGNPVPDETLDVLGTIKATGFRLVDGNQASGRILKSDAAGNANWTDMPDTGDDDWQFSGNNIYRSSGYVGVGAAPGEKLDVAGYFKFFMGCEDTDADVGFW